ncbi:MAG: hypothetical protein V3U07_08330 [Nitrospirales bacterium]
MVYQHLGLREESQAPPDGGYPKLENTMRRSTIGPPFLFLVTPGLN